MKVKPLLIANIILIVAMAGLSLWAWSSIAPDAQIPMHWNVAGHVDRFGSKVEALVFVPALAAVLTLVFFFLPGLDPRRAHLESSSRMWNAAAIASVALLAYVHVFIVLTALGRVIDVANYLLPGMAALFIVIGNYLPKTQSNWFAGVRTPWTLSSEYSWGKTHRLASRLFLAAGFLSLLAWPLVGGQVAIFLLVGAVLATSIVSIVASYFYWKSDPARVGAQASGET